MSRSAPDADSTAAHRLRKLAFRAGHRGIRELDILVGGFANRYLESLTPEELDQLEAVLHIPDQTLYAMLRGEAGLPTGPEAALVRRIAAFAATRFQAA